MKALVYEGNSQLVLKQVKFPETDRGEVLIRVHYTGICGTDMLIWHDGMARVKPPVTLGHEFSGVIEQVGDPDSPYKPGDRVVVEPLLTCGECKGCRNGHYNACAKLKLIGIDTDGGMAKYVKAPVRKLFRMPDAMSFEDAAFVEPLAVGVHMVRQSGVQPGQTALVAGGGPIGLIAAEVARLNGAQVFVSEVHPFRVGKATEFGFTVLNPQEMNVSERIYEMTGGDGVDVSFEVTGTQYGLADCVASTGIRGTIVIAGLPKIPPTIDGYQIVAKELQIRGSRVYTSEDYEQALRYIESGQFRPSAFISKVIGLDEAIVEGFEAIKQGEPLLKVLIRLENEG